MSILLEEEEEICSDSNWDGEEADFGFLWRRKRRFARVPAFLSYRRNTSRIVYGSREEQLPLAINDERPAVGRRDPFVFSFSDRARLATGGVAVARDSVDGNSLPSSATASAAA
ncbi:hypothetical protein MRB53_034819 [Persea americana]|uniref:Uncharacterized protein n=1 Tax=Persea americana TaxID=3435 RepID=A0ACC2K2W5_PERAE|nr:hypothetical protein MRB53_034819 [Persea americana]